jgi:hypothetical protein
MIKFQESETKKINQARKLLLCSKISLEYNHSVELNQQQLIKNQHDQNLMKKVCSICV